ncbi:MAG: glycine zipper 2TM domain-containing protein, partial [Marivita sp.]|uniref:glycine zipper 2TM domain-containing protein n=1 Tax=Marivita sp. TaxID=2003365 RepID=UPI003EF6EFA3
LAGAIVALPAMAQAQTSYPAPMSQSEVESLPPEYRTGPAVENYTETTVDEYGVETVTRTRRIESRGPYTDAEHTGDYAPHYDQGYAPQYAPASYAPATSVFEREQWIDECEHRTNGSSGNEKGGIIGGLLGAIAGGIIGNRVSDAERLGGTLIGAGVGGLGGLLIGSLIGNGRDDRGDYDCEAALDSYLSQYGYPGAVPVTRVAARTIPAPQYAPQYAPAPQHYGYAYAPQYQYTYAPPQQVVYVPVRYEQQQRVIVRETVREETVPVAARSIPAPAPRPAPAPVPAPRYEPRYVKGN